MNTCDMYIPGNIYTVWPMFARVGLLVCLFGFFCVEIYIIAT